MSFIIENIQSSNKEFSEKLIAYNFEEPKFPCFCSEGDVIRFAGWLIPKKKSEIKFALFSEGRKLSHFQLNKRRPDIISEFDLKEDVQKNGFDYHFVVKNNIIVALLIDDVRYDLWSFKQSCSESNYRIVEFLGPSGIGKTTLLNKIAPYLKKDWGINFSYLEVIAPFQEPNDLKFLYKNLIKKKAELLIENQDIFDIPKLLNHYSVRIQRDFWMVSENHGNMKYISDEGLFHLYLNEIKELIIEGRLNTSVVQKILEKRIIFNFFLDKKEIIKNLQRRALEIPGAVHDQIGRNGMDSALSEIESYYINSKIVIEFIRSIGGHVVDINLEEQMDCIAIDIVNKLHANKIN